MTLVFLRLKKWIVPAIGSVTSYISMKFVGIEDKWNERVRIKIWGWSGITNNHRSRDGTGISYTTGMELLKETMKRMKRSLTKKPGMYFHSIASLFPIPSQFFFYILLPISSIILVLPHFFKSNFFKTKFFESYFSKRNQMENQTNVKRKL